MTIKCLIVFKKVSIKFNGAELVLLTVKRNKTSKEYVGQNNFVQIHTIHGSSTSS